MFQRVLHVLYAIEFLIALVAVYTVWSQVGGQGHLDYMAWFWKAGIGFAAAYGTVRLTMTMASNGPDRRRRMIGWVLVLATLTVCAGLVTYYYHFNEPQDENDQVTATATPTARLDSGGSRNLAADRGFIRGGGRHALCGVAVLPALSSEGVCRASGVRTRPVPGAFQAATAG
jgi:hypothetical protein